jgi:outer membrane receptor for ferrienterochelin and colicin
MKNIRRSGATNIADVLRMAPGVDVAQIDSSRWAITIRGFNALYGNKVLVRIDGRSVYLDSIAGVFWGRAGCTTSSGQIEFTDGFRINNTMIPRSIFGKVVWRF